MRPRVLRIRLGFKLTRGRLAALLLVLSLPVIAQEVLRVTTAFPIPFAQYRRLLTTGVNPATGGPAHTFLAKLAGGVGIGLLPLQLFPPNAANPAAGGQRPLAPLVVSGQTTLGANVVPPMPADTLWLAGPAGPGAGIGMSPRAPGARWGLYPDGAGFKFWSSAAVGTNPLGLGDGVVFGFNNAGQVPYCRTVAYPPAGCVNNCTSTCPADTPYIWGVVNAAGERQAMWDETDPASCPRPVPAGAPGPPSPPCLCNRYHRCCGTAPTGLSATGNPPNPGAAVPTGQACGTGAPGNTLLRTYRITTPATCTGAAQKSRRNPPGCRGLMVCCRMRP